MSNDQLFKQILHTFFQEFLTLFFPNIAAKLDFSELRFPDKELFTDFPKGRQRRPDFLVQLQTKEGVRETILVHIEVQSRRSKAIPPRMFEYYILLRLRLDRPVLPIVLYLSKGTGGITKERHIEEFIDEETVSFTYNVISLGDLSAMKYLSGDSALGYALSSLMDGEGMSRVKQKALGFQGVSSEDLDEAKMSLLLYTIDKYIPLKVDQETEFRSLLGEGEDTKAMKILTSWEKRAREEGVERGIEQGIERGIEQGIEQGIERGIEQGLLEGEQRMLLRMLETRFGSLPVNSVKFIRSLTDSNKIEELFQKGLKGDSLEDVGL